MPLASAPRISRLTFAAQSISTPIDWADTAASWTDHLLAFSTLDECRQLSVQDSFVGCLRSKRLDDVFVLDGISERAADVSIASFWEETDPGHQ